jgi:hypothetical protein
MGSLLDSLKRYIFEFLFIMICDLGYEGVFLSHYLFFLRSFFYELRLWQTLAVCVRIFG